MWIWKLEDTTAKLLHVVPDFREIHSARGLPSFRLPLFKFRGLFRSVLYVVGFGVWKMREVMIVCRFGNRKMCCGDIVCRIFLLSTLYHRTEMIDLIPRLR